MKLMACYLPEAQTQVITYTNKWRVLLKILALEMGGNNALIIDEIENMDAVVNLTIQSAFVSAGQRCTCARRILVKIVRKAMHLFNVLLRLLKLKSWSLNDEQQPFMGGVISSAAATNMMNAQQSCLSLVQKLVANDTSSRRQLITYSRHY